MGAAVSYKDKEIWLSNLAFARLVDFVLEYAESVSDDKSVQFAKRLASLRDNEFWPGRGMDVAEDFPDIEERRFWARCFFELAQAIFDRTIGSHDDTDWQTEIIYSAYSISILFGDSVKGET